ncbi:hypothetical protein [Halovivax cerinus]|uniref:Uncharacterized protein n=1 Tax=Halovivax cerinus TaxID=1487865 RepID=A0ABD5NJM9_9EURY|nr:hypothetical protein [Halovivax cerinus]
MFGVSLDRQPKRDSDPLERCLVSVGGSDDAGRRAVTALTNRPSTTVQTNPPSGAAGLNGQLAVVVLSASIV